MNIRRQHKRIWSAPRIRVVPVVVVAVLAVLVEPEAEPASTGMELA